MKLLEKLEDSGYPTVYLLARIRGRRVYLLKDWNSMLFSPNPLETLLRTPYREMVTEFSKEGVWKRMLIEFKWVYRQMNKGLRDVFDPFFLYYEIKTIIVCLRYKIEKGSKADVEDLLSFSLLSGDVKELLQKEADLPFILEEFERQFLPPPYRPGRLNDIFLVKGLKGVEEEITDLFIKQIMTGRLHPVIKKFFTSFIDMRNVITLYKYLRWAIETEPVYIQGGSISEARLISAGQIVEMSEVVRLIYEITGITVQEPSPSRVENILFEGLTKRIRMLSKESSDIGLILDYLWKIYIEAKNLNIILCCGDIERTVLKKVLIIS